MIKTFRHKGLEKFFCKGSKAGIQPAHAKRLNEQLSFLNTAAEPRDMNLPGYRLHPLTGALKGHHAIWVNGNWRITFAFEDKDVILTDYQDYH